MAHAKALPLNETVSALFDDHGLLVATHFEPVFGVSLPRWAKAFSLNESTLRKNPDCGEFQKPAHRFVNTFERLLELFGGDAKSTMIWLRRPSPELSDQSPLDVILQGHLEVVEGLVNAIEVGDPG